jgi:hypothetical protein
MRLLAAAAALALLAATPGTAVAGTTKLQPGVHIDPGSPAAKQYQIPINSARSEAAGKSNSNSSNPPLFGQGVTPSGGSGAGGASAGSGSGGHAAAQHGRAAARQHGVKESTPNTASGIPASAPSTSGSSGSSAWLALGGGVLVLLLGGGGGLALRRRSSH